jgi:uncharacterized membrane protein YfcA
MHLVNEIAFFLVIFTGGLVAGTLNVLAGGGSFLTLPLLIAFGLPAATANGTNRVGILIQNVGAVAAFRTQSVKVPPALGRMVWVALAGAPVGTLLALWVEDLFFERFLAVAMVVLGFWTFLSPPQEKHPGKSPSIWLQGSGFFLAGVYGGFVQAGVGFLLLALSTHAGVDLVRGNAFKVRCVLMFTALSLAIFIYADAVQWIPGLVLGAGTWIGGRFGVRLSIRRGHKWLRGVVLLALTVFAVMLWFR